MGVTKLQNNLKQLRKYNGYTQKQIGEFLGITRQAYAHYETGTRVPNYVILAKLSDFYGISIDDLVQPEENCEEVKSGESNSPYRYLPERERQLVEMMQQLPIKDQEELILYLQRKVARHREREETKWKT